MVIDSVDTATELVMTTGDEIVKTAVVVPVDADEPTPGEDDPVGIENVGKFGGVPGVLTTMLVSS